MEEINYLVQGFTDGFKVSYVGKCKPVDMKNHPTAMHKLIVLLAKLNKEVKANHLAGPFLSKPYENFVANPLRPGHTKHECICEFAS